VITGPGNRYVAAAKKLVFGAVGIDSIAGPTEVVIVADETARADFVAADLLAQSEHGEDASAVLITTSAELAARVAAEVARQAGTLPRRAVVAQSLAQFGAIIVVRDLEEACALVNELAPEHLEIVARDEEKIAAGVRHAGAIFFGAYTPEAAGDYLAGPNHVLPTGGAARFSSALGVNDFLRRTSLLRYTPAAMERAAPLIDALARAEGLDAHARSALARVSGAGYRVSDLAETTEDSESERGARANATATPRSDLRPDTRHPIPDTRPQPGTPLTPVAASTVKPRVRELRAYTLTPERGAIKINQNENPWELPAAIKREAARRMEGRAWSRYPDFVPAGLHEKLARFAGWTPDGVVAGNGSNELIQATLMVTIGEGRRVLISEPTFALYRQVATVLGGEVLSVPLTPSLGFDAPALVEAVERHQPEVTIICSPNNPTGCRLADEDLRALLAATRGLVVVDEAYFEFAGRTVVPLLQEHPNLVVFRTFSKAMALAALRIGYLLAAPELAREIGKAVLPYNLNAFSQAAAEAAVELYDTELRPLVARIVAERGRLFAGLQSIEGLAPVASQANFMVVRSEIAPRRVFDRLLERGGVLVRDVSGYPMLGNCFRVSVGTPEENDQLLDCLRNIFGEGERGETSDARAAGR
jgi:histidinol-phosphate aminotransferase